MKKVRTFLVVVFLIAGCLQYAFKFEKEPVSPMNLNSLGLKADNSDSLPLEAVPQVQPHENVEPEIYDSTEMNQSIDWADTDPIDTNMVVSRSTDDSRSMSEDFAPSETDTIRVVPSSVVPSFYADLAFVEKGRVSEILVKPGDVVQKGQVLARQDQSVLLSEREVLRAQEKAAYLMASNEHGVESADIDKKYTQSEFNNYYDLWYKHNAAAKGEVARKKRDALKAIEALGNAEIESKIHLATAIGVKNQIAALDQRLKQLEIRATSNGEIGAILVAPGETVEDQPVLELSNFETMRVTVDVDLDILGANPWWKTADIILEFQNGEQLEGVISWIESSDVQGGQLIHLEFENQKYGAEWKIVPSQLRTYEIVFKRRADSTSFAYSE